MIDISRLNDLLSDMAATRPEVARHCLAVARLAKAAALAPSEDMITAAYLHDYGKILWPPDLFVKMKGDLSPCDLEIISSHPAVGRRLISGKWPDCPGKVLRLIERHHNPEGWLPAQLLAACDVWVACHEDRPYRTGAVPEKVVLREMRLVALERIVDSVLDALRSASACEGLTSA